MPNAKYLFQKAGIYYFRRRIAGYPHKTRPLMISLGSKDHRQSVYIVQQIQVEFQSMLNSFVFIQPPLPEELVRTYMSGQLRTFVQSLQRNTRMARMTGRISGDYQARAKFTKVALTAMLEHGLLKALPVQCIDPDWTEGELSQAMAVYDFERSEISSNDDLKTEFSTSTGATGNILSSREHLCQLREAKLKAKLAAFEAVGGSSHSEMDAILEEARGLVRASHGIETPTDEPLLPAIQAPDNKAPKAGQMLVKAPANLTNRMLVEMHDRAENAKIGTKSAYSPDMASTYWRMAKTEGLSDGVAKQRASDLRLFSLVTGIVDVRMIEQFHLSQYRDALGRVPKNFLRSDKDQDLTIKAVMARSELNPASENGLSASTMRRHFKSLELLLKRAKSEGHQLNGDLDVSLLKPKTKANTPAHKRRAVFRHEELQQVFNHTAWQGCLSAGRRHSGGTSTIKDSRYWVPLILAYTGARRAEIAGLLTDDLETIDGIPCVHVRANNYRGIKGEGAEIEKNRIIPVHPHLIDLGLLDHKGDPKQTGLLFPDVLPKKRKKGPKEYQKAVGKIGESLDDFWRKSLRLNLDGNPRALCMHSLRHYVNHQLIHADGVHEVTRFDLLGHIESGDAAGSINTSTYRDDTDVAVKLKAIETLKQVF